MQLYMHHGHVWKTACMIMLLEGLAAATPTINIPLNSQFPPIARVSAPFSFTLSESTFTSNEILTYSLSDAPSWLSLDSTTRTLSGTPPDLASGAAPTIDIIATDGSGSISMRSTLIVSPHKAPEVSIPIEAQFQSLGVKAAQNSILFNASTRFNFSLSRNTFTSNDNSSPLSIFAVTMDNTPLPPWISFDNSTMTFSGVTPDPGDLSKIQERFGVRLVASEMPGFAGVSVPFYIVVGNHKLQWDDSTLQMKAFVGKPFEFNALSGTLKLDGKAANSSDITSITTVDAPEWIGFNSTRYVLYGTPQKPRESASPLDVTVSAKDKYGGTASVVIRVTIANNIFSDGDIAPINATVGQSFSYNISQAFVDLSAVDIRVSVLAAVPWLSFDPKSLALSGDVSKSANGSSINITMAATPKLALSETAPDLKSFTINVVSHPLSTSSAIHTSAITEAEVSTQDSNRLEATPLSTAGSSGQKLKRGELTAVIILSIFSVIFIAGVLLCCGRRRRNRFQFPDPTMPLSKRDISTPRLQKKFSILGLDGSPENLHPGLRAKDEDVSKVTFNNPDPFSTTHFGATIQQSVPDSRYSNRLSSQFDAIYSGRKDFCRPFNGIDESEDPIAEDPDIIIIQNFPSESDEETKSNVITAPPSAVRAKGGAYSYHPYRASPRSSTLQKTPEASCTSSTETYRSHKRHRTPSDLGPLPDIPSGQPSSIVFQRTSPVPSERSVNRTKKPWSIIVPAGGNSRSPSVTPIEDTAWEGIPGSPIKSSSARPRSSLSIVTESTDVLYLGQSSPSTTTDDSHSLPSSPVSPFSRPVQTFLGVPYSPSGVNTTDIIPAPAQLPSRRGAGTSPFFSGTHRTMSRVQTRSQKLLSGDEEAAAKSRRRQALPEPISLRELAKEDNSSQALEDPGLTRLLDGLGSSRGNSAGMSSYTGSIEMTEDGTRRLISFLAAVDKRRSWVSETDSRQSFSGWDFEQENNGAIEVSSGALRRFKSYKSNVSGRSKTTFRGQSIWLTDDGQGGRGESFIEQMAALDYWGEPFGGKSEGDGKWARSQWSDSRGNSLGNSLGRLSAPVSPRCFELELWPKQDGNDGVGSIV
ncbi:hypothetical protein V495_03383 [Pseudogymnoascus sp. VKM F-4514 (FW-929)]|nr:hypothetical protein V495_03383 [Pseudogymnoascus sp. VKM F-4514 (FW-929)]KFY51945.1 hypothetical protein V497_08738 [Pseudogymnoascus sp. VKM F-4516 (FW-969)]